MKRTSGSHEPPRQPRLDGRSDQANCLQRRYPAARSGSRKERPELLPQRVALTKLQGSKLPRHPPCESSPGHLSGTSPDLDQAAAKACAAKRAPCTRDSSPSLGKRSRVPLDATRVRVASKQSPLTPPLRAQLDGRVADSID